ncbi:MAG: sulfatase-like hydrolase/transferase [Bacteroidota bacterium]|nr:sulfatase-like hydrolase/transferase [Bacteroidota bacterium]
MMVQDFLKIHLKQVVCISLYAVFPILFVFFRNEAFIFEGDISTPISIMLVAALVLYVGFNFLNKKNTNVTIICILIIWWFLLYGHLYNFIGPASLRHRYFIPVYSLAFLLLISKVWKINSVPAKLINVILIMGLVLNLQFFMKMIGMMNRGNESVTAAKQSNTSTGNLPDVYYIILDSYPSTENLKEYYNYDNSSFTKQLSDMGFQVLDKARSNYPYTYFSLSSSLNMEYINYFEDSVSIEKQNEDFPFTKIRKNKVANYFKSKGYKYVQFASAYEQLNDKTQADLYINNKLRINNFHETLIQLSVLNCLQLEFYSAGVYDACNYSLNMLPKTPEESGPKFVFFHSLTPHPPHVFDENGNFVYVDPNVENRYKQKKEYTDQVKFINKKMLEIVKQLIAGSDQEPIIILQGDHGSAGSERFEDEIYWAKYPSKEMLIERYGILNAMHIPEKYKMEFPTNHTPVNTFRIIFNNLFNDTLQPLPCKSYFASYRKPYNFKLVNWDAVSGANADSLVSIEK